MTLRKQQARKSANRNSSGRGRQSALKRRYTIDIYKLVSRKTSVMNFFNYYNFGKATNTLRWLLILDLRIYKQAEQIYQ